jgi:hypothetical protein
VNWPKHGRSPAATTGDSTVGLWDISTREVVDELDQLGILSIRKLDSIRALEHELAQKSARASALVDDRRNPAAYELVVAVRFTWSSQGSRARLRASAAPSRKSTTPVVMSRGYADWTNIQPGALEMDLLNMRLVEYDVPLTRTEQLTHTDRL